MKSNRKPGGQPGPSTAEETESAERQPGAKGHPAQPGPAPGRSKETGSRRQPPNNSAPGAGQPA
jgi:hypothetical protein